MNLSKGLSRKVTPYNEEIQKKVPFPTNIRDMYWKNHKNISINLEKAKTHQLDELASLQLKTDRFFGKNWQYLRRSHVAVIRNRHSNGNKTNFDN